MLIDCHISSDLLLEKWSNDDYGENFRESYKVFEGQYESSCRSSSTQQDLTFTFNFTDSRDTHSGCAYLPTLSPFGQRILHWEIVEGVVCLRDVCDQASLENNAVCIHLGGA